MANPIGWCTVTVNPFPGCRKVSPGCQNCYAERMAKRLKAMGQTQYENLVDANGWTGKIRRHTSTMHVPGKGKMVFVNSMGDFFHEGIPDYLRDVACWHMADQPQHVFQLLTKRVENAKRYFASQQHVEWPLRNVWIGVTCENQEWADKRIPVLLQIPAAVRYVSLEPLLEMVDLDSPQEEGLHALGCGGECDCAPKLDWVIVGAETGPHRRPCDTQWIADIVEQCAEANVPVYVKQINIDGKVAHDPDQIALELSGYVGRPLCDKDIRQFPEQGERT